MHPPSTLEYLMHTRAHGSISLILVLCPAGCKESFLKQIFVMYLQHLSGNGKPAFSDFEWLTLLWTVLVCLQSDRSVNSRLPGAHSPCNVMRGPNRRPPAWARLPYASLRIIAGQLMRQATTRNLYPRHPWSSSYNHIMPLTMSTMDQQVDQKTKPWLS